MKYFLALLTISLSILSVNAQVQISDSGFYCNEEDGSYFITQVIEEEYSKVSFKRAIRAIQKQVKQAQGKDTKAVFKNQIQDIKNCRKGYFLKETPSYETVTNDCTGEFDISANENSLTFDVQGDIAIASGVIDGSIVRKTKNLIKNNPQLRTIVMTYMPGSENDERNVLAARLVHNAKISTCVPDNGFIASGAVDYFLAGVTRSLATNSFVGVHSWADGQGREGADIPRTSKGHNLFLNYYRAIDINTDFYWFTLEAAPAADIHDMTAEERLEWGMETSN